MRWPCSDTPAALACSMVYISYSDSEDTQPLPEDIGDVRLVYTYFTLQCNWSCNLIQNVVSLCSSANIKWSKVHPPSPMQQFTGHSGPRVSIPSVAKEIFCLFFTSTLIDLMVEKTNRYVSACLGEKFELWTAVNADELCAYMRLLILMGFVKLPSLRDYWKKDKVFNYPPIANVMS